jgi:hypothetical protein
MLAEICSPSHEFGRATPGRKGDARRDEQRGVAVVLSPDRVLGSEASLDRPRGATLLDPDLFKPMPAIAPLGNASRTAPRGR